MISQARIDANRKNAKKSTGPKSADGKARSSRNALKHGLAAAVLVVPGEDVEAYDERRQRWLDDFAPANEAERFLIERAVHASWRLDRCARFEAAKIAQLVRHASDEHERKVLAEVEILGDRLFYEPLNRCASVVNDPIILAKLEKWHQNVPSILVGQLQSTAQGVAWMIRQWEELSTTLNFEGYWHYPERNKAIRLLGKRVQDLLDDFSIAAIFLACRAIHPEPWDIWDDAHQARLGCDGKPMYLDRLEYLKEQMDSPEKSRADLQEFVANELNRLRKLHQDYLQGLASTDRAEAPTRALIDESPTAALAQRYEASCERTFHRALNDLMKLRKTEPRQSQVEMPLESSPTPEITTEKATAEPEQAPAPAATVPPRSSRGILPNEAKADAPKSSPKPPKAKSTRTQGGRSRSKSSPKRG